MVGNCLGLSPAVRLGDWCPLSMLSHMLDCQLYGLNPAGHHLTNLLLHAASAVALFLVLWRMTARALAQCAGGGVVRPASPARRVGRLGGRAARRAQRAVFHAHPGGLRRICPPSAIAVALSRRGRLFALGLMAKSMLVTLPALLLLLDFWPLGRFGRTPPAAAGAVARPASFPWRVVLDKLPLFALAIAAAVVTMFTHVPLANPLTIARAAGQRGRFVRRLSGPTLRPGGALGFLFPSRGGLAGLAGRRRGGDACWRSRRRL